MSSQNSSVTDALSRNSSATAQFLSSLNSSLGAGGGLSQLFQSLLSATDTAPVQPNNNAANNNSTSIMDTTAPTVNVPQNSFANVSDVVSALHNFAVKWNNYQNSHQSRSHQTSDSNKQTSTSSSNASSSSNGATAGSTSSTSSSSDTSSASTDNSNDPSAPPTFAEMLAQLQAIFHMLQKQIQTAQAASTDDTSTPTTDTKSTEDLLAAGGALADLLALAQSLEKKFGATASASMSEGTNTSANVDPNLAALDTQLRANLKDLLDKLKAAATPADNQATTTADATTAATATTDASLLTTTTTDKTDVTVQTPQYIIKGALATADDFLKQLSNLYGTPTANVAAAVAIDSMSSDSSDAAFDPNQGGNNTSTNGTNTTNNTAPTAETQKSSNTYSFASQLSAARAQNGGNIGLPTPVEQVLLQLNRGVKSGNDQMSIQLHPADLGTINVKLNFGTDGTVTGTVVASNADTLNLLQKDQRSLERALQDAGLQADPGSLQFSLGGQTNGNSNQANNQGNGGNNDGSDNGNGPDLSKLIAEIDASTTENWIITPGRVNIQV